MLVNAGVPFCFFLMSFRLNSRFLLPSPLGWLFSVFLLGMGVMAEARTVVVKKGETCYRIAKANGVSAASLMSANEISDPTKLRVGQKLRIPEKTLTARKKGSTRTKSYQVPSQTSSRLPSKTKMATLKQVATQASTYRAASSYRKTVPARKMRVIVDAGHGGRDKGAYWHGVSEASLNMKVAKRVQRGLLSKGYPVTMTRRSDVFISLSRRCQIANRYRNAVFVSIHFNACRDTRVSGAETYYSGKKGRYLAKCIQSRLVRNLKVRNRGVRYGRYAVLRGTRCPAVLVECGFISNPRERMRCNSQSFQIQAAQAIVDGVARYDRVY